MVFFLSSFPSGITVSGGTTSFLKWLCGHLVQSALLWHHQACVGEGKAPLTLSHWKYVFLLANLQFSWLRKAEGMVRHFCIIVSCCPTTPVYDIWCGVLKKCCFSRYDGEPQQQKRNGPLKMESQEDSQEVGCRVPGLDCLHNVQCHTVT